MKKIAFILALVMIFSSALWGCDTAETDTTGQAGESSGNTDGTEDINQENVITTGSSSAKPSDTYLNDYSVVYGNDGEYRIYIKAWDSFRKIKIPESYADYGPFFDPTSAVIKEDTATVAVYYCESIYANVTVYHFNRDNEEVDSYTTLLSSKYYGHNIDRSFINVIDENTICFFQLIDPIGRLSDLIDAEISLTRFVSEDGGKTWSTTETLIPDVTWENTLTVAEFASHEVGIISYSYVAKEDAASGRFYSEWNDAFDGTYITTDGGLSWNRISARFSDIVNYSCHNHVKISLFSYSESRGVYELFLRSNSEADYYFISENMIDWEMPIGK